MLSSELYHPSPDHNWPDVKTTIITLEKYLYEYLETHAKPNFKPTFYDTKKTIIEARIIPVLGKVKLQARTPRAIKGFYAELRKKYSKAYVKNIHGVLKRVLRLGYTESGLLDEDIMSKVSVYTGMRRGEILGLCWKDIDFEKLD